MQPETTLLAAAEAADVDIVTGCTKGMCGTDAVRIVDGGDGMAQPSDHEKGTLERMGLGPDFRLACSAKATRGPITVDTESF